MRYIDWYLAASDLYLVLYIGDTCMYHVFFFFKQKTAYELRISDWSSDVCSSDLSQRRGVGGHIGPALIDDADHAQRHAHAAQHQPVGALRPEIGRASCRERVCQYV